jgi:glycosyltransferase involved in cell wall biosynthesis
MRILMGIPFLYPAIGYGGAARSAYELSCALHDLGHHVTVLTTDVWDSRKRYTPNGSSPPFEVVRVPNLSNKVAYYFQFYTPLGVLKHAERLLAESDILHLHTFRNLHNDLLARTAVKQGKPFVLSGHGTIPRIERFQFIKKMYDLMIGRWQLDNAAAYLAVSIAERKAMKRMALPEEKIRVIPNGVGDFSVPEAGTFRKRWGLDPAEKVILFLGKITPRKGVQHLVRAFARIRNKGRLVIAGNDMGYASYIRKLIAEHRLQDRVLWTGLLNDDLKFEALSDANITVYPSVNEVFGLVPLESILAGTPVIVCDDDGCGQIIRKTGAGDLVPWGDPSALSYAITRRLEEGKNPEEIQRAQEKIRLHFNWHLIAREMTRFYQSCLNMPVETPDLSASFIAPALER